MIRVKKAFTLIELIIVIILVSTIYFLMFSNTPFVSVKSSEERFSLVNLKEFLIDNYEFQNEISFVCIEKNFDCFVRVDGTIDEKIKVEKVFNQTPEVYEYNNSQIRVDLEQVRIENIDNDVVFEFKISSDYKFKEYIVDTLEDRVYVYNSIFKEAKVYDSLGEAFEEFEKNIIEVKDAF